MKKLQAVRAGAGSDITSSYEPEGENVEEKATYGGERVYYSDDARKRAMQRDAQRAENEAGRRERAAAKRRKDRNQLRKQGQYGAQGKYYVTKRMEKESVEMKPVEKTPEGMGDITFDAGGAIPTTIKAIGDPRELETAMKLKKTQLRASGLNMSHEPEGDMVEAKMEKGYISNVSKADVRNQRRFGKKGSAEPTGYFGQGTSEKAKLAVKRGEEHKARRGVKTKGMGEAYTVTKSDKTGNTKAYQDMKAGKKNQITGEPLYKKADHMNENLVTIENLNNVSNINVKPSAYKSEKDVIKDILNNKADVAYENRQVAMEPEKHPDPDESDKPYAKRSRAARMRDPKRGINSPAFKKFMADRGM